ncbi:aldehyde dehydrogenase family protein [Microbacterium rhizomatis]|uniref:Aldehyde dehydrogenase family protein n=1 Tax=Microbacterium rhizomatis TaxID=1631477 RepID=A0A5J5J0D8_9MICO|nr:aldehyde dehydrogenase family protein [Microbacterium rhizomatis]
MSTVAPSTPENLASTRTFEVVNPANGLPFADAPDCTDEELDAAVARAARAFTSWRVDDDARRQYLRAAASALRASTEDLAPIITREQGKTVGDSRLEIQSAIEWFEHFAEIDDPVLVIHDDAIARVEVHRRPLGPVAAITPWNFPIALAIWKIAPALRAGNTVVLKPSPYTPLSSLKLVEILAPVLPEGVLNVVTGRDPLGAKLASHPGIRKISFTGSTATGKRVAAAAADDLKRVTLELGGNDPAIVLDDADPQAVATGIFWSAMANSGQICMAVKRLYVPRSLAGPIVDVLAANAQFARVGDGFEEGVNLGPINNAPQFERVTRLVQDALDGGARAVTGGLPESRAGYFFEPTVLVDVRDDMPVVAEEQFGPVLPVLVYDDLDEAVARANDSKYGLGSSVWTSDPARGAAVAARIEAGTTWINGHLQVAPYQPFGGVKWSGLGTENGLDGLHEFSNIHVIRAPGSAR